MEAPSDEAIAELQKNARFLRGSLYLHMNHVLNYVREAKLRDADNRELARLIGVEPDQRIGEGEPDAD